jgi:hypothetical protein
MLVPRRRVRQRKVSVESIKSRTTPGKLSSLNHLLELAHAVGSQAELTAAEAERNRKADDAAVRTLIESGLLRVLQPARFGCAPREHSFWA